MHTHTHTQSYIATVSSEDTENHKCMDMIDKHMHALYVNISVNFTVISLGLYSKPYISGIDDIKSSLYIMHELLMI